MSSALAIIAIAVATEMQLVLVALEEIGGKGRIARQGVVGGVGAGIGEQVGIVRQQLVAHPARHDREGWVNGVQGPALRANPSLQAAQATTAAQVQSSRSALQTHLQISTLLAADVLEAVNKRRKVLGLPEIGELTADTKLDAGLSCMSLRWFETGAPQMRP